MEKCFYYNKNNVVYYSICYFIKNNVYTRSSLYIHIKKSNSNNNTNAYIKNKNWEKNIFFFVIFYCVPLYIYKFCVTDAQRYFSILPYITLYLNIYTPDE